MESKDLIDRAVAAAVGTGAAIQDHPWILALVVGYLLFFKSLVGLTQFFVARLMGADKDASRNHAMLILRTLYSVPEITSLPPPTPPDLESKPKPKAKSTKKRGKK